MANGKMIAVVIAMAVAFCCAEQTDTLMTLTTLKGEELVLRPDNTWEPAKGQEIEVEKDFTVPLADGRFVLIGTDGSWGFVKEELVYAEDLITTNKIVATGSTTHIDVNSAVESSKKKALASAVSKTKAAIAKIKNLDYKKLEECVTNVEKEVESKEDFSKTKGWTVTVVITLDKGSILAVVDCARKTEEPKKE